MGGRLLPMEVELPPIGEYRFIAVCDLVFGKNRIAGRDDDPITQFHIFVGPPDHRPSMTKAWNPAPQFFKGIGYKRAIPEQLLPEIAVIHERPHD